MHLNVKTYETEAKLRLSDEKCFYSITYSFIYY